MESSTPMQQHSRYRPEIDGIRAFAVIAVILNHLNKDFLPSGYLGVDIFFVISGFVITSSLARRSSSSIGDFLLGFYTRRIKRLVPVLILFVLICSVSICFFNPNPDLSLRTGIKSLFGFSNFYLLSQSTDYFADSTELNIFTHTWSLGVEEQFYFLFPLLTWATGFSRSSITGGRNLFAVMAVLSIISLICFISLYPGNQPAAYFLMPTRLWEMGTGCLLFLTYQYSHNHKIFIRNIPPSLIIFAITITLFLPLKFAVPATISVVTLTTILIACLQPKTLFYRFFTHPRIVYVGLISYSLYLWHWGVLSISRWTIGIHWWTVPFQIYFIFLLSILTYQYVETPLRHSSWPTMRWQTLVYGITAISSASVVLLSLTRVPDSTLYLGHPPSMIATGVSSLEDTYSLEGYDSSWQGKKCILSHNSEVGKKVLIENCTLGNFQSSSHRVAVFGNSFSAAFIQAFESLIKEENYSVTLTSSWGASPVPEVYNDTSWDEANDYYWNIIYPSFTERLKPGDWVFLISDMESFSPTSMTSEVSERLTQLERGMTSLSAELSSKGIKLAVLHGIPFAREANCKPAIAAKQWFTPFGNHCKLPNRSESLLRRAPLDKLLISLENEGKLRVIDVFDVFCPDERCTYNSRDGQILYRDEFSHPSIEAAHLTAPIIHQALKASMDPKF